METQQTKVAGEGSTADAPGSRGRRHRQCLPEGAGGGRGGVALEGGRRQPQGRRLGESSRGHGLLQSTRCRKTPLASPPESHWDHPVPGPGEAMQGDGGAEQVTGVRSSGVCEEFEAEQRKLPPMTKIKAASHSHACVSDGWLCG